MPNGKGHPDCSYCQHFKGGFIRALRGEKPLCALYEIELRPLTSEWQYRLCSSFSPTKRFHRHNIVPLKERFARFPIQLDAGILYVYKHHGEEHVRPWMSLRTGEEKS
jgi:hypothetical protein